MTAAQAAQQNNRTGDGRYAEKAGGDPGDLDLGNRFLPSVFDVEAANPEVVLAFDADGDEWERPTPDEIDSILRRMAPEAKARGMNRCTICGNHLRYVVACDSEYGMFLVGEDCAESLQIASRLGTRISDLRAKAGERRESLKAEALRADILEHDPELADALTLRERSDFLEDLYRKLGRRPHSDKQREAAIRTAKGIRRRDEQQAAWDAMSHIPVPEGKQTVTGTVVSVRHEESNFGYRPKVVTKMLVVDDRGFKVWVTCPAGLRNEIPDHPGEVTVGSHDIAGSRVSFDATLQRSDRDERFGFGSRPSKPKMLRQHRVWTGNGFYEPEKAIGMVADLDADADAEDDPVIAARIRARADSIRQALDDA